MRRKAWEQWPANLEALLEERFAFIKNVLEPGALVLELGAGRGHTRRLLDGVNLVQTDVEWNEWLDVVATAESLPFADNSFDAVLIVAVLHHLDFPLRGLDEAARVVRPGGRIFVSEPHGSVVLRALLRFLQHEHYDPNVDPYSDKRCKSEGRSSWDGNNAIPDLIFGDRARFARRFPMLQIDHSRYCECLLFINSGGVNIRTPHIPMPDALTPLVVGFDRFLAGRWPGIFALGQEIVLTKRR